MIASPRQSTKALYVAIAFVVGTLLVVDALTARGYAEWILHASAIAMCLFAASRFAPLVTAAAASLALALGFLLSPGGEITEIGVFNRTVGALTFWILAGIVYRYIISRDRFQHQTWLQQGLGRIASAVRGEAVPSRVAGNVLRTLTGYLHADVAAYYIIESGKLRRLATWAVPAEGDLPETIDIGAGLLGQAVVDNRVIHVRGIPANYLRLGSTLGSSPSGQVIVAPITADGDVIGAIELGYARGDGDPAGVIEFLGVAAEAIGMSIRAALYRHRLEDLLSETQRQSEELQVQQEELRVSNEELEERGRALMESQTRLEAQQADLEQSNVRLEEHAQDLERQKQQLLAAQHALAESAHQLESANQYKSQFLANMSHELRTPLNSSLILSRLLMDNKHGNLSEEQVRYAGTIHSSNADLLTLINDILDLSRVEAGHIEVELESVPVANILQSLEQTFRPQAVQKGLTLALESAPGVPAALVTDNQRLTQILKNLIANALKFTEAGGVTVRVAAEGSTHVRFEVQDSGIGIPPEQHQDVFDAFRQADGSTRRKYGGSGLGLAISREFAELLGGRIEVASQVGEGSTFTLYLPVVSSPAPAQRPAAPDPARSARPGRASTPAPIAAAPVSAPVAAPATPVRVVDDRHSRQRGDRLILVIEDDAAFARILYDLAHELDFDCVLAGTAQEGIALAREHQPCGILLDMGLPDNSGLSVLEQLKRSPDTRHIPIHVASVEDHAETALHLGAVGYTLKPVAREQIIAAIDALQDRLAHRLRRILVIEDDDTLRENIGLLLSTDGVEIRGVGTVADAIAELTTGRYDCVVMDLVLPDGTGYDLLELMSEQGRNTMPPVIVYTGRSLSAEDERRLRRYSRSIIIKGARSPERLLDEVTLFLHSVEAELPPDRQRMLKEVRQRDTMFEGRTILLAEDDIRNIFALSQVIEPLGAKLEIARNGREAVERLNRAGDEVDLVLMDIMMPEMDGLAAMEAIRAQPRHAKLPIIALTAKAMASDRQRCIDAGANDYIAKPIDVDKLLSLCRVWLPH
ncbi:response regulator [Achromobacter sp. GG226]|uniref:response regulator n=1 Tax=Verticiella alkaliphila TaxID=2779529 RepID=UPI00209B6D18|nr:response regulator [Verticiella sp. GG226]MBU4610207.1 response regulator [Verticiella sp. GG226]